MTCQNGHASRSALRLLYGHVNHEDHEKLTLRCHGSTWVCHNGNSRGGQLWLQALPPVLNRSLAQVVTVENLAIVSCKAPSISSPPQRTCVLADDSGDRVLLFILSSPHAWTRQYFRQKWSPQQNRGHSILLNFSFVTLSLHSSHLKTSTAWFKTFPPRGTLEEAFRPGNVPVTFCSALPNFHHTWLSFQTHVACRRPFGFPLVWRCVIHRLSYSSSCRVAVFSQDCSAHSWRQKRVSSDPQRFTEPARVVSQWSESTQQVRPFGLSQTVHFDCQMDCWMSMCCLPGAGVLLLQELVCPHQF